MEGSIRASKFMCCLFFSSLLVLLHLAGQRELVQYLELFVWNGIFVVG
jgi:hypothetical protein